MIDSCGILTVLALGFQYIYVPSLPSEPALLVTLCRRLCVKSASATLQIVRKNSNAACCSLQTLLGLLYCELWSLHLILLRSARVPADIYSQAGYIFRREEDSPAWDLCLFLSEWVSERDEIVQGAGGKGAKKIYGYDGIMIKMFWLSLATIWGSIAPVEDISSPEKRMLQIQLWFFLVIFVVVVVFVSGKLLNMASVMMFMLLFFTLHGEPPFPDLYPSV